MAKTLPKNLQNGLLMWLDSAGKDLSGNGNNGTLVGSPPSQRIYQNAGMSYNGSSQHVVIPTAFLAGMGDNTFAAWVYLLGYGEANGGHVFDARGTNAFILDSGGSGFGFYSGTGNTGYTGAPTLNKWTFVCGTRIGTALVLYINLFQQLTGTTSGTTTPTSARIANEYNDGVGRHFYGYIVNPMIWNRGLTPTEVQQLYFSTFIK